MEATNISYTFKVNYTLAFLKLMFTREDPTKKI